MTHRYWILATLGLAACQAPPLRDPASLLPASIAGTWHRQSLRTTQPTRAGVERAFEAAYEGAGHLTVDLYETKVSGTAFEMTQHWREAPDSVFFDKGRYFAVVKWEHADRSALTQFVRELQRRLGSEH